MPHRDGRYAHLTKEQLRKVMLSMDCTDEELGQAILEMIHRDMVTAQLVAGMFDEGGDAQKKTEILERNDLTLEQKADILGETTDLVGFARTLRESMQKAERISSSSHVVDEPISDESSKPPLSLEDQLINGMLMPFIQFLHQGHRIVDLKPFLKELGSLMVTTMLLKDSFEKDDDEEEEEEEEEEEGFNPHHN